MTDHILFATDYPHWDFDAPDRALPRAVPQPVRDAIMRANAHALYRLRPARVPAVRSVVVARADEIAPGRAQDRRDRRPLDRRVQHRAASTSRCATAARTRAGRCAPGSSSRRCGPVGPGEYERGDAAR